MSPPPLPDADLIDRVAATINVEGRARTSPWVPARVIAIQLQLRPGVVSRAADILTASGRIRRRWIATQWWYRAKDRA